MMINNRKLSKIIQKEEYESEILSYEQSILQMNQLVSKAKQKAKEKAKQKAKEKAKSKLSSQIDTKSIPSDSRPSESLGMLMIGFV